MGRISVVVPIYNVEEYLEPCLDSLAGQTFGDLEVVMVDDGSTDGSAAIAERYASGDARFRLVTQPNGGLSKARNTGIDHASGEFLVFLDSDDMLPPNAYELLHGALERTGSDFATGNVHRLTRWGGTSQSPFLARAFAQTQLATHITRFRPLLADRTAWNKLFRRRFWDAHGLRFPVGRVHEDIPVTLPAHFMARSVDVIAEPVYLYRIREVGELSITQRRLEQRVLRDRLSAIETVSGFLAREGPRGAKHWYDESVVADDLRLHLNILDSADDEYRALFLDRVNAFLDRADDTIFDPLPALDRLKWHLVRRRLMPELLEVLRFQKEDAFGAAPVRAGRHWYGDYPFRTDERLAIPSAVYRLDQELALKARVSDLRVRDGRLAIRGFAHIAGIGAAREGDQQVSLVALRPGRAQRVRRRLASAGLGGLRLRVHPAHRPEVTAKSKQAQADLAWTGFEAELDPARLRRLGRPAEGRWELQLTVTAGGVRRRRARFAIEASETVSAVAVPAPAGLRGRAAVERDGTLSVELSREWAELVAAERRDDGTLELRGELSGIDADGARLELRRESGRPVLRRPLEPGADGSFLARVALEKLLGGPPEPAHADEDAGDEDDDEREEEDEDEEARGDDPWHLSISAGGRRRRVMLAAGLHGSWALGAREVALVAGRDGGAVLVDREPRPVITHAAWGEDGDLELAGELPGGMAVAEVTAVSRAEEEVAWAAQSDARAGSFRALLRPARIESLAGTLPLADGLWQLYARGGGARARMMPSPALAERLPLRMVREHKPFLLRTTRDGSLLLDVARDLDDDERGPYHQRRLRSAAYRGRRSEPLREAVVYFSFGGRQYSDSPRAIHEELVRRGAPLEHLWVVRDLRCRPPGSARPLREGSREYHEALARARYVVANDHFPDWFERREDQLCLQTWHGTPLKRLGLDVSEMRRTVRKFQRRWDQQLHNWQYVLSPNRFSTPILRRAYAIEGEMLETGYPRVDVLAGADREERAAQLRRRLGIPDGVRTVLYAPTYRDHAVDRRGRYRLDNHLDVERLRAAVGGDTVVLYRKHHYVIDPVPATEDGFVRDVSSYPDGTELMLAADVLVTDYSSMMVDFANTGRPMLFLTHDLDDYRDEIRGFYLDFVAAAPGPLLRDTGELAAALRDLDGVVREHAGRYAAFRETFCELDDGNAAARVVERLFT